MKKTSVYLDDADVERLRRLAEQENTSQAAVLRAALEAYEAVARPNRKFALTASGVGDGRSVADIPEEELLEDFGADAHY